MLSSDRVEPLPQAWRRKKSLELGQKRRSAGRHEEGLLHEIAGVPVVWLSRPAWDAGKRGRLAPRCPGLASLALPHTPASPSGCSRYANKRVYMLAQNSGFGMAGRHRGSQALWVGASGPFAHRSARLTFAAARDVTSPDWRPPRERLHSSAFCPLMLLVKKALPV
jgi:hypothetical protein